MRPKLVPELICSDLQQSLQFYMELLGFNILYARTAPKMRSHDRCGHAWDRWFQEFLTKTAYHPPKFPTERQAGQLLELAERIGSPTQIRKGALAECVR